MQQFYSVNMSFRRGDGGFDVFTSKKFSSKSSAEKAARRMRKAGFRRSLSEEWKAEYSIVTYTKYGTVFDCETVGKSKRSSRRTRSSTTNTTTSTNNTTTNTNLEVVGRNITMTISDGLFSNYTVQAYGKGFLLVPQEGDENWGTKYFHDGWWMPKNNAWFFRSKYYDFLIENGAVDNEASPTTPTGHVQTEGMFSNYSLEECGKGYLVRPPRGDKNWGIKYFYIDGGCGWWMPKHNAWFFKSKHLPFLIDNGVKTYGNTTSTRSNSKNKRLNALADKLLRGSKSTPTLVDYEESYNSEEDSDYVPPVEESDEEYVPDEEEPNDTETVNFFDYTVKSYKRGFLLIPEEGDRNWGTKYFHNGWWMPSQNAWFFRSKYYDFLIENGARALEGTPRSGLCEGMSVAEYGRGFLLTAPKKHPLYGQKYFYNDTKLGWWMKSKSSSQQGWFFRKWDEVIELLNEGAVML